MKFSKDAKTAVLALLILGMTTLFVFYLTSGAPHLGVSSVREFFELISYVATTTGVIAAFSAVNSWKAQHRAQGIHVQIEALQEAREATLSPVAALMELFAINNFLADEDPSFQESEDIRQRIWDAIPSLTYAYRDAVLLSDDERLAELVRKTSETAWKVLLERQIDLRERHALYSNFLGANGELQNYLFDLKRAAYGPR